jgi:hypothetical protein
MNLLVKFLKRFGIPSILEVVLADFNGKSFFRTCLQLGLGESLPKLTIDPAVKATPSASSDATCQRRQALLDS